MHMERHSSNAYIWVGASQLILYSRACRPIVIFLIEGCWNICLTNDNEYVWFSCSHWSLIIDLSIHTKFETCLFYYHCVDTSVGGLFVPGSTYHPSSSQCFGTDNVLYIIIEMHRSQIMQLLLKRRFSSLRHGWPKPMLATLFMCMVLISTCLICLSWLQFGLFLSHDLSTGLQQD
jgi:hypothetical protein